MPSDPISDPSVDLSADPSDSAGAPMPIPAVVAPPAAEAQPASDVVSRDKLEVIVHPLPKVIFFYPTWIASIIFALVPEPEVLSGQIWLCVFFFNLLVVAADFNEDRTLILGLGGLATVLGLLYFGVLGNVGSWLAGLNPSMNHSFYSIIAAGFTIFFIIVWLRSRLDYWTFRPNEVVHRSGLFPKMKRYSTEDLRWDKEVPDVLERILAGSGRIILTTPHERHPVIIEHVLRIGKIDDKIADLLGVKAVVTTKPDR
ncbi:MAG: hypothetical protein H8E15_03335 [Planctomycetes bacterium]|nr:hypothetical protein [Planctomycetota bacterium]